jgi:hypothetical protein
MQGTGPQGPAAVLASTFVVITFPSPLTALTPSEQDTDTGVSTTQSIWLTGYQVSSTTGTPIVQSVWISGAGGNWRAAATVVALDNSVTDVAVRVFYTYTA